MTSNASTDATGSAQINDGYPDPNDVLREAQEHEDYPDTALSKVEIQMQPSGEAVWRVTAAGATEYVGGYYAPR